MEEFRRREYIADFSKHIPHLLQHQLILEQTRRYTEGYSLAVEQVPPIGVPFKLNPAVETNKPENFVCGLCPSLQRFHGAILFVDISGFTALSQKLDVESLKNHINGYFSRIIEIIEHWGGDVVKFAGDALYVVWKTRVKATTVVSKGKQPSDLRKVLLRDGVFSCSITAMSSTGSSKKNSNAAAQFRQAASDATEKATRCGLEIIDKCGNFPVYLDSKQKDGTTQSSHGHSVISTIVSNIAAKIVTRSSLSHSDTSTGAVAFLNVHAGVAVGLMAGVDIGAEDRWEYFTIGEPMTDVARAEDAAEKGDVVLSESAHQLFHPQMDTANESKPTSVGDQQTSTHPTGSLSCGCFVVGGNCYRLKPLPSDPINSSGSASNEDSNSLHSRNIKSRHSRKSNADVNLDNAKLFANISLELRAALSLTTPAIRKQYLILATQLAKRSREEDEEDTISAFKRLEKLLPTFISTRVRRHYLLWLENSLLDNLARHVHDVARQGFLMTCDPSMETFRMILQHFLCTEKETPRLSLEPSVRKASVAKPISIDSAAIMPSDATSEKDEMDDIFNPAILRKDDSTLQEKHELNNKIEAELRTVTVMFIKIDSFDMSLLIDTSVAKDGRKAVAGAHHHTGYDPVFGFLDRTENEHMADQLILRRLQRCMEVLHRAIYDHGGQMRQFMVDDKGTVCIASFGLRGSVNEDNAANALEAANAIIHGLQEESLGSSIGVTTGKVYCGLVGSTMRHEFALMGPSVNLSARLMCKATLGSILCDHETMQRDRSHDFKHVGDIKAKGYEHPVPTYRQAFEGSGKLPVGSLSFGSLRPFLKKFSSHFNMSMSYDNTANLMYPTISVDGRVDADHLNNKLARILNSEFVIVDQVNTISAQALKVDDSGMTMNNDDTNNKNVLGVSRALRGRKAELTQLMEFLFADTGRDKLMCDYEAMPRLAVVVGSGGLGKTALLSAIGRKMISSARQDSAVNVVVLRNRSNAMSSSTRHNPWKPILLEILRVVKRVLDSSAEARAAARKQKVNGKVHVRRESFQDLLVALDAIFKHMPHELQSYKSIVMSMLNFPTSLKEVHDEDGGTEDVGTEESASFDPNSPSSKEKPARVEDLKIIMTAILNFCVSYTKKIMLVMIENVQTISVDALEVLHYFWSNCRGVHFLLTTTTTYRPEVGRALAQSIPSYAHVSSNNVPMSGIKSGISTFTSHPSAGDNGSFRKNSFSEPIDTSDMFGTFAEVGRFMQLTLEPLSKDAALDLVTDLVKESDQATLDSIVSSSGGNPLYIVQLTKSLIEEGKEEVQEARHAVANISAMCRRVEEIICYRLDQLDSLSQAVLKAASVAASHGKTFTPNILAFALKKTVRQLQPNLMAGRYSGAETTPLPSQKQTSPLPHGPMNLHHANSANNIDPRIREIVVQCMTTLVERGEFIHFVAANTMDEAKVVDDQDMNDDNFFSMYDVRNDTEFEFRIPTEQTTIYSLIIDEQREYFHGKVAQYYYRLRYDSEMGQGPSGVSGRFANHMSCASSRHSLRSQPSAKRLSQTTNTLTLQWLLFCEQEIGFHAEQAKLWPLAMRAYLHVGILSRRLGNHRQFIGGLLEAFKIVKSCEQESGETITPLTLSYIHANKIDKGPNTVAGIISRMYLTGDIAENDRDIILQEIGGELDCVFNVFGNDPTTIILAAKLNLYLADFYILAFGETHLVPEILGIAMKLSLAARLCEVEESSSMKSNGAMSTLDAADEDQLIFSDLDHATSINNIEGSDLVHFVCTHFNLVRGDPSSEFSRNNTWKDCEIFETLFEDAEGGVSYDSQLILQALLAGDLTTAISRWRTARNCCTEQQMLIDMLRFGQDTYLYASSVLLQQLVYANKLDMIDSILVRIDQHMEMHHYSLLVFVAIIPAVHAMVMLGRWEIVAHWMDRMYRAIDEAHEIMVAQISLVRAMHQWLHNWLPLAHISLPPMIENIMLSLQKSLWKAQAATGEVSSNCGCPEENKAIDEENNSVADASGVEPGERRASSLQEDEETQMLIKMMTNMQPGGGGSVAAARRRSSIVYLSSFLAVEDLYVIAVFFLRPDRPAVAPELLRRNTFFGGTSPNATLEQWAKVLPPAIARFISHCGFAVESLGIQLLAMWLIHHPMSIASSTEDKQKHKEAEGVFRSTAGHLVHFAVNFVGRLTDSSVNGGGSSPKIATSSHSTLMDSIILANLTFTVSMLHPLREKCPLINECLLGADVPFTTSLVKLLHFHPPTASTPKSSSQHIQRSQGPENSVTQLRKRCPFLFQRLETLLVVNKESTSQ